MRFRKVQFCSGFLLVLVCAAIALAQNATGSITGAVTDPNNEVVTNAAITVTNKATGAARRVTTKGEGNYSVENLFPGEYEVKVEAQGFVTQIQMLTVQVGNNTTGNFSMTIGVANQTIEVTGGAPLVNTTDATIGGVVTRNQINDLPLNGRSFLSVAGLQPGVTITYNATSGVLNQNSFFNVSVGGAPAFMTTISVDGARANDRITGGTSQNFSSETVQEFQISTIGFDLSAGTVSAGAVNVISRSGSNDFHGSGFFFFRDHNMSAFSSLRRPDELLADGNRQSRLCNNLSSAECASARDPYFVRKQYGGTLGGPIKKNKLFFFGNYERNDQVGNQNITFNNSVIAAFNHIAKVPFKQHLVGGRLDYTISNKHTAFLRGNIDKNDSIAGTGLESTWIDSGNFSYQTQLGLASVLKPTLVNDFRFSYSYFRNFLAPPTEERCLEIAPDPAFCFGVGGPRITFFGGLTIGNDVNTPQDRHPRTYQFTDNVNWTIGAHRLRFGGDWEHTNGRGSWRRNGAGSFSVFDPTTAALVNSPLYASLPASLKPNYVGPRITFADLLQLPVNSAMTAGVGDPSSPNAFQRENLTHNDLVRFYIQDAWQIRPSFTLNYGLAWSFENNDVFHDLDRPAYLAPLGISLDKIPYDLNNFDPALGFAWTIGKEKNTVIRASASLHHTSANRTYLKLSERNSISPLGAGLLNVNSGIVQNTYKTGPGLPAFLNFSAASVVDFRGQDFLNNLASIIGQMAALTGQRFNGTDLSVRNIELTKQAPTLLTDTIFDRDFHTPYTIHINAGVQREIMRNLSVSADFVMRRGVGFGAYEGMQPDLNLWNRFSSYTLNPTTGVNTPIRNPVIPACSTTTNPAPNLDPTNPKAPCSVNSILYGMPGILSRYSALQVKVDKRLSQGFQLTGAYALARYTTFNGFTSNTDYSQNSGLSDATPKHQFTFSGIWDLPKYQGGSGLLRAILNGYQVSSLMQIQSGGFSSVTLGVFDLEGDGTFTFRLPGASISSFGRGQDADDIRKLVEQYNATIPAAPTVTAPNVGRNQRDFIGAIFPFIQLPDKFSSGDSFITQDIRLARTVSIGEKIKLQLIGEGFNIFNVANMTGFSGSLATAAWTRATAANPSGTRPSATNNLFGQATGRVGSIFGSGGPRAFQFAARLSF
ncbi:MAG TPA: carboxypeptidase-like regulatory domain-containing protein [Blastocatellia bacterium]|nr:carboxypeptidase-like regulatory domain-containing protein [Blastocatellia bacterium]